MEQVYLYFLLIGCKPEGRHTEQHDVFLGIGKSLGELVPQIKEYWPEAKNTLHVDAWRQVMQVEQYGIRVIEKTSQSEVSNALKLFFINLGGYKPNEFDELHHKILVVAKDKTEAIHKAKKTKFYKNVGFANAPSHIDDKYGVDIDEIYNISEILPAIYKAKYRLIITENIGYDDSIHVGYFPLDKL